METHGDYQCGFRININILECKFILCVKFGFETPGININILECKFGFYW